MINGNNILLNLFSGAKNGVKIYLYNNYRVLAFNEKIYIALTNDDFNYLINSDCKKYISDMICIDNDFNIKVG